jgi:hypothetical protein
MRKQFKITIKQSKSMAMMQITFTTLRLLTKMQRTMNKQQITTKKHF